MFKILFAFAFMCLVAIATSASAPAYVSDNTPVVGPAPSSDAVKAPTRLRSSDVHIEKSPVKSPTPLPTMLPTVMPTMLPTPNPTTMSTLRGSDVKKPIYFGSPSFYTPEYKVSDNIQDVIDYLNYMCGGNHSTDDIKDTIFATIDENYGLEYNQHTFSDQIGYEITKNNPNYAPLFAYYDKIGMPIRNSDQPDGITVIRNGYLICPHNNMYLRTNIHFDYNTQPIKHIISDNGATRLNVYGNVCYPKTSDFSEVFGYSSYAVYCVYNSNYQVPFAPGYSSTFGEKTPINPQSYIGMTKKKYYDDNDNNNFNFYYPIELINNTTNTFWNSIRSLFTPCPTRRSLRMRA